MTIYYRPLIQYDRQRPKGAVSVAGGWCWFELAERIERGRPAKIIPVSEVPQAVVQAISAPRADIAGLGMGQPSLMGILNVTPDSFSDGGQFQAAGAAIAHGQGLIADGADILDIGGESTRPGAETVPVAEEIARIAPVVKALSKVPGTRISVDTRKGAVAQAAINNGAVIINDVSAFNFDPKLSDIVAKKSVAVCLMHAQGTPKNMQDRPEYDDVLLDVYDALAERIAVALAAGIDRKNIIVDPGIGFGKTRAHNLALLRGLGIFHGLGCPIMLGASRKRFIGDIGNAPNAADRGPGSIALTLAGVAQGVQIHRVHDIKETRQALALWQAATGMGQGND